MENNIKPIYDDIKYKDYFEPIKRLSQENNNIFDDIIKKNEINDLVMQYYIKSSTNIITIVLFPNALKYPEIVNQVLEKLRNTGDIHYTKTINCSYLMCYNLLYQLYFEYDNTHIQLTNKLRKIGFTIHNNNDIMIIIYTLKDQTCKISGTDAEYKRELREMFYNKDIENNVSGATLHNYLHISDTDAHTYDYAGVFFNDNSLKFLQRQQTWRLIRMYNTNKLFKNFKQFMSKYTQQELEKLLIFSSGVLFSYGIREANDIDGILLPTINISPSDIDNLDKNKYDISYKGSKEYNDNWEQELNNRAVFFGASNYQELVINPKYYFYFMGFKILRLKYDLMLRFKRYRPAQITDLLVIRQMFNFNYELIIPKTVSEYNETLKKDEIKDINENKLLSTIKFYLKNRYHLELSSEQIKEWIYMKYNNGVSTEQYGGNKFINFTIGNNIANKEFIYPTTDEIIKMGYMPKYIIYSSDKPYLYPGEEFKLSAQKLCNFKENEINKKNNSLRIATFNVHNFITRCNTGIAPLFGSTLNPFSKPKDINKFINLFKTINADVLCLQELVPVYKDDITFDISDPEFIRNNFNFKYFNELMENIGYKYNIIGSTTNGKFYNNEEREYYVLANGIYSKYEFIESTIYNYSYLNRNIINVKINYNNDIFNIVNTHLEYFDEKNPILLKNNITHSHLIQEFIDLDYLLDSVNQNNNNVILCGDLNINIYEKQNNYRYKYWDKQHKFIKENFINNIKGKIPTNFSQDTQTDYILTSKQMNYKNKTIIYFTKLSDHFLLYNDIY